MDEQKHSVSYTVYGRYALFSDPITRPGGEKFSYYSPTYQALKGIAESIYWKPTFVWYIDKVRVMNRIQTESKGIRPIKMNGGNDLSYYTYLRDVAYQVQAHFEWNEQRQDLAGDRDGRKHLAMANRFIKQGGRRDVFLGTRECQAYAIPCVFGEGRSYYDGYGMLDFGLMFHSFDYPGESGKAISGRAESGKAELGVRLWKQHMTDGIIEFEDPRKVELRRVAREYGPKYTFKKFTEGQNFRTEKEEELD